MRGEVVDSAETENRSRMDFKDTRTVECDLRRAGNERVFGLQ